MQLGGGDTYQTLRNHCSDFLAAGFMWTTLLFITIFWWTTNRHRFTEEGPAYLAISKRLFGVAFSGLPNQSLKEEICHVVVVRTSTTEPAGLWWSTVRPWVGTVMSTSDRLRWSFRKLGPLKMAVSRRGDRRTAFRTSWRRLPDQTNLRRRLIATFTRQ